MPQTNPPILINLLKTLLLQLQSLPVVFGITKASWISAAMIDIFQIAMVLVLILIGMFSVCAANLPDTPGAVNPFFQYFLFFFERACLSAVARPHLCANTWF